MELQKEMLYSTPEDRKRQMKTPLQLEVLEQVFAEEKYPSEAVRSKLSIQLGLSNRQLKMWFCHRRLKERKSKGEDEEPGSSDKSPQQLAEAPSFRSSTVFTSPPRRSDYPFQKEEQLSGSSHHSQDDFARKFRRRVEGSEEKDFESPRRKRSRQTTSNGADSWRVAELRAIASIEAQLGEPLRWDSPCLGIEFDPLPPGAFLSSAVPFPHRKPSPPRCFPESNSHSKAESWLHRDPPFWEKGTKNWKVGVTENGQYVGSRPGSKLLQEYQFIPERPTGRDGMSYAYERSFNSKSLQGSEPSPSPPVRGSESITNAYGLEGKSVDTAAGFLLQRDVCNTLLFPQSQVLPQNVLSTIGLEGPYASHINPYHVFPSVTSFHGIEKLPNYDEQEVFCQNNKRKNEEIRIAKEVDAHRKRLQKELEREELARRKREEQLQKEREKEVEKLLKEKQREDEKLMRDKQREDERLQRERQREDERLQREARRESERQERFMQKEAQRLEREREKEEARRLKEATRLKAAIERATARRLARECVELIDDERLELLEAAATSQGLPSIYLLDGETLQGLDRYKDFLKKFPPSAVKMKKPLAISPWIDFQQNLGNLFMVWRFLIAFADVLGLWPFTLDELVQAFHDYESRLLAEIHIALFKIIVKDIEDMAKASANAGAVNQYTAASTIGGGHTQLVEAAFAWGLDYRNWSRYLNGSTWPEVLRQFSLAAGFGGSIWKQQRRGRNVEEDRDMHAKGNSNVNFLRSGAAATKAAIFLKVKGGSQFRKNGSRLTPGTVKFAAFHVLSVEGSGGLPIVEIVTRIEKYGLRDFSTSKTPESSVAAALSRDTTFFERVAPSTYCVKPVYRKNPEDAERLLQAAVERIRLFQSGALDAFDDEKDTEGSEEGEKEPLSVDDAEDDLAIDEMHEGPEKGKISFPLKDRRSVSVGEQRVGDCAGKIKSSELQGTTGESRGRQVFLSSLTPSKGLVQDGRERRAHSDKVSGSAVDNEIDESHVGEPWVQGLLEGEYSGLSVEERLNALVALVEVINEGNTVRVALEDRMEAATALKRQMWAEAQLDKRRFKEEQLSKSQPQVCGDSMKSEGTNLSSDYVQLDVRKSPTRDKEQGLQDCSNQEISNMGVSCEKSRAQLKVDIDFRADELYVFRSLPLGLDRRRNRYWQFVTSHGAEDPGCGRVFFESSEDGHWEVIDTEEAFDSLVANLDIRGIREAHLHGVLVKLENQIRQGMRRFISPGRIEQKLPADQSEVKAVDLSIIRSSSNGATLAGFKEEDGSSGDGTIFPERESSRHMGAIRVQIGNSQTEKHSVFGRYKEFDKWFWSKETPELSFLAARKVKKKRCLELLAKCDTCHDLYWHEEKHCACCHATFEASSKKDTKYVEHVSECENSWPGSSANEKLPCLLKKLPCRVQLLKSQFLCVEAAVPAEALRASWSEAKRKTWASSLKHASSASDLRQLLSELETAIHRDWLSRRFEPAREVSESDTGAGPSVPSWVPCTTAAVAMRLGEFDSALFYSEEQRQRSNQRKHSIPEPEVHPSKKDQVSDTEAPSLIEGLTETGIKQPKTDCSKKVGERSTTKSSISPEYQQAVKIKFQGFKKHSDTSITKERRGFDFGSDDVVLVDKNAAKIECGIHSEGGKQFTSPSSESEEHRPDLSAQKAHGKHELRTSEWTGSFDARAAASEDEQYEDDRDPSGTEEEVVIEEDFDEEDDTPFEQGHPGKKWLAVSEGGETDSMGEESADESNVDDDDDDNPHSEDEDRDYEGDSPHVNKQKQHFLLNSEEDGEGEGTESRSSDSESFDESG